MAHRRYGYAPGPWRDAYGYYGDSEDRYDSDYRERSYDRRDRSWEASRRYEDDRARYEDYRYEDNRYPRPAYSDYPSTSYQPYQHQPILRRSRSPPREPAAMRHRDDRPVTPPPVRSPSPSYLALAEEAPSTLSSPTEGRKLLILDLNGTLVHRSPYTRPKSKFEGRQMGEPGRPQPRLRPVHPRPYMGAFRQYLFAQDTKEWLDVMIWSSAQPHSVTDMVDKCFGEEKEKLVTIWARDTLGLSADQYSRKVQTVKDLATPWAKLPSLLHPPRASTPSSGRRNHGSAPVVPASEPGSASMHSAMTTLLLDDSPAKAVLQPYNHVCLPEYSAEARAKDLELLHSVRRREAELQDAQARAEGSSDAGPAAEQSAEQEDVLEEESKRRRRKERKEMKKAAKRLQRRELSDLSAEREPEGRFDETLLAVVGILDEIKMQRNVAAWIRSGGLWGPHPKQEIRPVQVSQGSVEEALEQSSSETVPSTSGNDEVSSPSAEVAQGASTEESAVTKPDQPLWFEHQPVMEYWVSRGREALDKSGIPVVHGVER